MSVELKIPALGESIQEVQIGRWLKQEGEAAAEDENVVELETDKASMELPSPVSGKLVKIVKQEGESVSVGEVIAIFEEDGQPTRPKQPAEAEQPAAKRESSQGKQKPSPAAGAKAEPKRKDTKKPTPAATPSARRALREAGIRAEDVAPQGDRLRAEDVERHLERQPEKTDGRQEAKPAPSPGVEADTELEETVPMSLIRRRIAQRLVEAQKNAALLTTFNEIDMTEVKMLRKVHGEAFEKRYGVRLGFVSFFIKASIEALKAIPELNAEIQDRNIVYHNYYDIGIAVGGGKGLVVPALRNSERKSFSEIEREISDLAKRARANKLELSELEGGTFTISNGGIYGSLLSTPIINPPQSGILGLHAIQDRPVARNGEVVIRPMMYVALTYDHRLVDGREAVTFLKRVKELMETPSRMLLEI